MSTVRRLYKARSADVPSFRVSEENTKLFPALPSCERYLMESGLHFAVRFRVSVPLNPVSNLVCGPSL